MCVIDHARLENRKSSNDRNIARMARILTIFGPKKSQRRKLFDEQNSNDRNHPKIMELGAILAIFGRLKIFDFRDVHYLLHTLTIENCH